VVGAAAAGRCLLERELGRGGVAAVDAAPARTGAVGPS
jgi:hypothetical protein